MAKSKKKRLSQIILIVGVVVIPLLYSYFYLDAFWDPYSRLDTLPVAVVNNDQGAVINGKNRNLGQELCNELNQDNALKFIITDKNTAEKGTGGTDYYAMIEIPSDFSSDVASAGTTDKQTATITFSPNEKRNFLASQILSKATLQIEEKLRSNVSAEITQSLTDQLLAVPDQLQSLKSGLGQLENGSSSLQVGSSQLQSGLKELKNGSTQLQDGTSSLQNGTAAFASSFNAYQSGVNNAASGASQLSEGVGNLQNGLDALLEGAEQLDTATNGLSQLQQGAATLSSNLAQFDQQLGSYTTGVQQLLNQVNGTSQFLTQYVTAHPELMRDPSFAAFMTQLHTPDNQAKLQTLAQSTPLIQQASGQLKDGAAQLSDHSAGLADLKAGIAALKEGVDNAKAGTDRLANGAKNLHSGMTALSQATGQLGEAAGSIQSGAASLNSGAQSLVTGIQSAAAGTKELSAGQSALKEGIISAKDSVTTSLEDADTKLRNLNGLDTFVSAPVTLQQESVNPVPNYGTAFSPYFLSLSMWVGALIIFVGIFLDSDEKFKLLSRNSNHKMLRTLAYLLIALTQAFVLALVIKQVLGLQINHLWMFYLSCCLVSMVFLSIVQFLMIFFKDIGKFLALLLLILQLTSCGGTFPMETVPKLFNVLYPFMPMTYSVNLFREAISGTGDPAASNIFVLVALLAVFTLLTLVFSGIKHKMSGPPSASAEPVLTTVH